MSDYKLLRVCKETGIQTWGLFIPDSKNPEVGTMHVKEVMPPHRINSILSENHEVRSNFRGYKQDFTPSARIPENLYWHLRKLSGEQDGQYDRKHFQKLLKNDYRDFRVDKGGSVF